MEDKRQASIAFPPGGILIWFLIILELFTFLGGIFVLLNYRSGNPAEFNESAQQLNPLIGTFHTLVLITSGYFLANAMQYIRLGAYSKASSLVAAATMLGFIFLSVKALEFYLKMDAGFGFSFNQFFTLYWMMAGFHFIHVLFGVGLLIYLFRAVRKRKYTQENLFDAESIATYWHLCDLIWIFIFPLFYLLQA